MELSVVDNMADKPAFLADISAAQLVVFSGDERVSAALKERWALEEPLVRLVMFLVDEKV